MRSLRLDLVVRGLIMLSSFKLETSPNLVQQFVKFIALEVALYLRNRTHRD